MVLSEKHGPPLFHEHISTWSKKHQDEIQTIMADIINPVSKAVIIEGGIRAGKTTLAAAVGQHLPEAWDIHVTLAQFQNTFHATTIVNERTRGFYKNLPPAAAIEEPTLIIIDEIKKYPPQENFWKPYIEKPQTKFILLSQEENPHMKAWQQLFGQSTEEIKHYQKTP